MKRKSKFGIFLLVIVAAALVVVFVTLFTPPSTRSLALSLNSKVTSGYLSDEDKSEVNICEYNDIQTYLTSVASVVTSDETRSEIQNIRYAYKAFLVEAEFFNRQIVFSSYSEKFKENKKKIEKLLSQAQKHANAAEDYIEKHATLTSGSAYWTAQTWAGVREDLVDMTKKTAEMFKLLGEVYSASVDSKIMNNDLTTIIFRYNDELSASMVENLDKDNSLGQKLHAFVNHYMTIEKEEKILEFCYNIAYQVAVQDILASWGSGAKFDKFKAGVLV